MECVARGLARVNRTRGRVICAHLRPLPRAVTMLVHRRHRLPRASREKKCLRTAALCCCLSPFLPSPLPLSPPSTRFSPSPYGARYAHTGMSSYHQSRGIIEREPRGRRPQRGECGEETRRNFLFPKGFPHFFLLFPLPFASFRFPPLFPVLHVGDTLPLAADVGLQQTHVRVV